MRKKQWLGFLVMLIGACLLLGPYVQGDLESFRQNSSVEDLRRQMQELTTEPTPTESTEPVIPETQPEAPASEPTEPTVTMPESEKSEADKTASTTLSDTTPEETTVAALDRFYQDALAYNQKLVGNGQIDMSTLQDLQHFELKATDYGMKENYIGTISIPRLDVEVPLYLGASDYNMGNGFAIFGKSSLPLGQGDENSAIAGHRGWHGTDMLRNVQKLLVGDPVYITTPWQTLTYIVSSIEIVTPMNLNWCRIVPGKTMISLMTCHPYGEHTHRYIVHAELQPNEPETMLPTAIPEEKAKPAEEMTIPEYTEAAEQTLPASQPVTFVHEDGSAEIIYLDTESINPDDREYSAAWSDTLILAEDRLRPVAYITAVVVACVGIWLIIATIRDHRKEEK